MTEQALKELFAQIACDELGIQTLERRNRDSLDFHDLAVWSVEAALRAAFEMGAVLAPMYQPTPQVKRHVKRRAMACLLRREGGASLDELCKATGWIETSVRRELARICLGCNLVRIPTMQVDGVLRYRLP